MKNVSQGRDFFLQLFDECNSEITPEKSKT
jgi:hypothetical protein